MESLVANPAEPTTTELLATREGLVMHPLHGLLLEDVPLAGIAALLGTPCWVYGAGVIRTRYRRLAAALRPTGAHIYYAVKANDHLAVLRVLATEGAGADVVSEGEFCRAQLAGIPPARIVFSGVGKDDAALRRAVADGVGQINVESAAELETVARLASEMGIKAPVALRVNPDVDAGTHAKITTGRAENKFGIAWADVAALYAHAASLRGIVPVGLALHIGSQILSMAPFRAAYLRVAQLVRELRQADLPVQRLDCGGGLGVGYGDAPSASPEAFAGAIASAFGNLDLELVAEPGRWLVAPAGVLLGTVILSKQSGGRRFMVLDAAMNDLIRPALYDAWHGIVPIAPADPNGPLTPVDVVGPVCESGDTFARARMLPALAAGARLAILDAGAYGAVMSSTYNARPLAAIAMVDGDRWDTIRPRQEMSALWETETVPEFLR